MGKGLGIVCVSSFEGREGMSLLEVKEESTGVERQNPE